MDQFDVGTNPNLLRFQNTRSSLRPFQESMQTKRMVDLLEVDGFSCITNLDLVGYIVFDIIESRFPFVV